MRNYVQHKEIINTNNKSGIKNCSIQGKTEFIYDNYCKGYLLNLNTGSITIPKNPREPLEAVMPYLLLQVFIFPSKQLTIELAVTDSDCIKRRLIFTQGKQIITNAMHTRLPNSAFYRNNWINLYFDLNSIFNVCYPSHSFRSLEMIFITGTLKLKKIVNLMLPASQILQSISEVPKFPIFLQEVDSNSFPKPRPLYYSHSPPNVNKKKYYQHRENIFRKDFESPKQLKELKTYKSLRKNIDDSEKFESKPIFNKPYESPKEIKQLKSLKIKKKKSEDTLDFEDGPEIKEVIEKGEIKVEENLEKEINRKITHNHTRNMINFNDEIEESIEADENSWIDLLNSKMPSKEFDSPDFYDNKVMQLCQIRHITPPFVNLQGNQIIYNPVDRYYDNQ